MALSREIDETLEVASWRKMCTTIGPATTSSFFTPRNRSRASLAGWGGHSGNWR